jgi:hypothetical protein
LGFGGDFVQFLIPNQITLTLLGATKTTQKTFLTSTTASTTIAMNTSTTITSPLHPSAPQHP